MSDKEIKKIAIKLAGSIRNYISSQERKERIHGIIQGIKYARGIK